MVQTREGLQFAEAVVFNGVKKVRDYVFEDDSGNQYKISCTDEHKFDLAIPDETAKNWTNASDLEEGQEIWAVDSSSYQETLKTRGTGENTQAQFYFRDLVSVALVSKSEPYDAEVYDIQNCDNHEYIANGLVTHNSGGLCSFCLSEDTLVAAKDFHKVPIKSLLDCIPGTGANDSGDLELETPYGQQVPQGVIPMGKKPCIEIKTKRGHSLKATLDHKILTLKEGKIVMQEVGSLSVGSKVILTQKMTGDEVDRLERDFLFPDGQRRGEKKAAGAVPMDELPPEEQELIKVLRKAMAYSDAYNSAISQYYDGLSGTAPRSSYISRLTQGMKAKKYMGGVAAKAKASSNRLFEQYFKPLI